MTRHKRASRMPEKADAVSPSSPDIISHRPVSSPASKKKFPASTDLQLPSDENSDMVPSCKGVPNTSPVGNTVPIVLQYSEVFQQSSSSPSQETLALGFQPPCQNLVPEKRQDIVKKMDLGAPYILGPLPGSIMLGHKLEAQSTTPMGLATHPDTSAQVSHAKVSPIPNHRGPATIWPILTLKPDNLTPQANPTISGLINKPPAINPTQILAAQPTSIADQDPSAKSLAGPTQLPSSN